MRLSSLFVDDLPVLAGRRDGVLVDLTAHDPHMGSDVGAMLARPDGIERVLRALPEAPPIVGDVRYRPLVPRPGKVLCLGLNDVDHAAEANLPVPTFPEVFTRVASSLIGHRCVMLRGADSLDYEAELAVIIGRGGRHIAEADALEHVAGYSVFNDGTIRTAQLRNTQWTLGKNYHGTGALGPELVTPDELPPGASGLRITTRVGGELLQDGNTGSMVFGVARTIALLSQAVELEPGDVIAMGTPSGIGFARSPQRFLVQGEVCRVTIERIGELETPIENDPMVSFAPAAE